MWSYSMPLYAGYGCAADPAHLPSFTAEIERHTSGFAAIAAITAGSALSKAVFSHWIIRTGIPPAPDAAVKRSCANISVLGFAILRTRSFFFTRQTSLIIVYAGVFSFSIKKPLTVIVRFRQPEVNCYSVLYSVISFSDS